MVRVRVKVGFMVWVRGKYPGREMPRENFRQILWIRLESGSAYGR